MSNRRKQTPKMPDSWQSIIGQLKSLLADSSTGIMVIIIDQSTIVVDHMHNSTRIDQHGTGNLNSVGSSISTFKERN